MNKINLMNVAMQAKTAKYSLVYIRKEIPPVNTYRERALTSKRRKLDFKIQKNRNENSKILKKLNII